jgi:hypothetical protein
VRGEVERKEMERMRVKKFRSGTEVKFEVGKMK